MRTVKINNELVYISPNWGVSDKINARTTCQFTVVDLLDLTEIFIGADVLIEEGLDTLFAGTVEEIEIYEPDANFLEYAVTAVDYSALADKRLIADSVVNKTAGEIVKENILPILAEEGVTEGVIEDGQLINKSVFNYDTATVALDYIKDVTGLNWEIDFSKRLNLFSRDANLSSVNISDTTQTSNFSINKNRNQYRNTQFVRAGRGKTTTQALEKPTPKPDGVSRNFIVRFPLAEKPRIFLDSVEVLASDIGVNGLDTGKKFYFTFNSNVITQDESETVLSTELLEITYVGLFPILVRSENASQILDRQSKEPTTSGIYEKLQKESSLNESAQALEFSEGLLQKYGIIPSTITFDTEVHGIEAGQLLSINKTLYGINDSYLVEEVNISAIGINTVYTVKCLDGSSLGGWEEFFKDMLKGQREFVIQENEVVIRLISFQDVVTISENLVLDLGGDVEAQETVTIGESLTTTTFDGKLRVDINEIGFGEVG